MNDGWYDPLDDIIELVPTKDEIESAKSVARHERKQERRYEKALSHQLHALNGQMKRAMRTDVVDDGDHYTVKADLPGFDKKDISVSLSDGVLTVSAKHTDSQDKKDEKTGKYLRRERTSSAYERSFAVGDEVKPEEIHASYENGVLCLTIPKKETEKKQDTTKKITVQ